MSRGTIGDLTQQLALSHVAREDGAYRAARFQIHTLILTVPSSISKSSTMDLSLSMPKRRYLMRVISFVIFN